MPKDHPIQAEEFHSDNQFHEEFFVLFSLDNSNLYYEQIIGICRDAGFSPRIRHKSLHALTILKLVENDGSGDCVNCSAFDLELRKLTFSCRIKLPNSAIMYTENKKNG